MPRIAKKGRGLLRGPSAGVTAEARNAAIAAAHREGQTLGSGSIGHPPEHQSRTGWELAPTLETTLAELVKTMQAQNARLEAVEARRGLFGALWPRKAA